LEEVLPPPLKMKTKELVQLMILTGLNSLQTSAAKPVTPITSEHKISTGMSLPRTASSVIPVVAMVLQLKT